MKDIITAKTVFRVYNPYTALQTRLAVSNQYKVERKLGRGRFDPVRS